MKVYDSPGRGKKQCPKCNVYVGVRNTNCPKCMHSFERVNTQVEKKVNVFDLGGQGRKPCKCGKYVGVRTRECPECGHKFEKGAPKVKPPVQKTRDELEAEDFVKSLGGDGQLGSNVVLTPSGKCPVKLASAKDEDVVVWCDALMQHGRSENKLYTPSALRYWVRDFFDANSVQNARVCMLINGWANDQNKETEKEF